MLICRRQRFLCFLHSFLLERIVNPGRWYFPLKVVDRFLRAIGWCYYVETGCGLKFLGKGLSSDHLDSYVIGTYSFSGLGCSFDEFVINPDFLVDAYSLAGTPITRSPHYFLIDVMSRGGELLDTEYVYRFERGILDLRRGEPINQDFLITHYQKRLEQMRCHNLPTVKAFLVERNGQRAFIIGDGKHRLAMAAYFGYRTGLRISLLDYGVYKEPFFQQLYHRVMRQPKLYTRNLQLLEVFYGFS